MGGVPGRRDVANDQPKEGPDGRLPLAILAVGLVVAGGLLFDLTSRIGFLADDWNLLILRQGWGVSQFLDHFNGHPIMAPALIYKVLQEAFGMASARPMQVVAIATFLVMNFLLFIYLRRRVGDWAALIGTFLILFLGAAFEDLLWSFQIGYFGSLAAGIGALIALDRNDRGGDIAACLLLVLSLLFSSIGLAFLAAGIAEWLTNPRDRRGRLFVAVVPATLYFVWWLIWGRQESPDSLNPEFGFAVLPEVPRYVFDAFAAGITSLAGLATGDGSESEQPNLIWGQLGALILIGGAIWRIRTLNKVPKGFLITGAGAIGLLLLFALGQDAFLAYGEKAARPPTSSRYQLPIAVFIVLSFSNLLQGVALTPVRLSVAGGLSLLAISGGIGLMSEKADERWAPASNYSRAALLGIESATPDIPSGYTFRINTGFEIPSEKYLQAIANHGSPALKRTELAALDPSVQMTAEQSLIGATGITLSGTPPPLISSTCQELALGWFIDVNPGRYVLINLSDTELSVNLARISAPPGVPIGAILPEARAGLDLPRGALEDPWKVSITGEGPAQICEAR